MEDHNDGQAPSNTAPEGNQTRSMTPLSYLSAPVPDYASSLLSHLSDQADDANTAFLRDSLDSMSTSNQRSAVDHSRDPRLGLSRRQRNVSLNRSISPAQRERIRFLAHQYRTYHPPASTSAAYSNRTPSPHRQSIYDWAPSNTDQPEVTRDQEPRRQSDEHERAWVRVDNHRTDSAMPEVDPTTGEQHLPSATARMLRYFMDRERSGLSEEEERARNTGWYRPSPSRINEDRHRVTPFGQEVNTRARQEYLDAFRRHYLPAGHDTPRTTTGSPAPVRRPVASIRLLENAVRYLDSLQSCESYDEALAAAMDYDLVTKDLYVSNHDEFILDLAELDRPYETSYLQSGTLFEGHQYATSTILSRARDIVRNTTTEQINPHYRPISSNNNNTATNRSPLHGYRNSLHHGSAPSSMSLPAFGKPSSDHWPVRMTIHQVDEDTMTLQGTMEAYDVPRLTIDMSPMKSGNENAPITTYVEGHIIDFFNHSFLTTSKTSAIKDSIFPAATAAQDAENWHRLPPFSEGTMDDMAHLLLSKDRILALNQEYLFMRWKERCFVHSKHDRCSENERRSDHDRGHGLTISGFYYISLRRSDGLVEGVYYDPHGTPCQHLKLKATSTTWPAWQFR